MTSLVFYEIDQNEVSVELKQEPILYLPMSSAKQLNS